MDWFALTVEEENAEVQKQREKGSSQQPELPVGMLYVPEVRKATSQRSRVDANTPGQPNPDPTRRKRRCECMATEHALFTNCLSCGRIVCEAEGEGPCVFCGSVVSKVGTSSNSKQQQAVELKNKMLQYQRDSVQRTAVFDDETDWFASDANQWLSPAERAKLSAKEVLRRERQMNQLNRSGKPIKVTFDLAGRRVIAEESVMEASDDENEAEAPAPKTYAAVSRAPNQDAKLASIPNPEIDATGGGTGVYVNLSINGPLPLFQPSHGTNNTPESASGSKSGNPPAAAPQNSSRARVNRVQHTDVTDAAFFGEVEVSQGAEAFSIDAVDVGSEVWEDSADRNVEQEIASGNARDRGMCLSMHQPWASLFVHGIKRVEGRTWSHEFRGRLWIASTVKDPEPAEIEEMEEFYRNFYGENSEYLNFPSHYPAGCLLGCVDVIDCLPNSEFSEKFPAELAEESDSPFVFIGAARYRVVLPLRVQGKHKIWKLDTKTLDAAQQSLKPVRRLRVPPK
eukprot:c46279_g1_i1.p1 GENE.c46279_g1_i1~~c46279_g1_i1.p1  ORF type:complete len:520 (+),score=103.55 c46279_g1_i1:29-1561(+)